MDKKLKLRSYSAATTQYSDFLLKKCNLGHWEIEIPTTGADSLWSFQSVKKKIKELLRIWCMSLQARSPQTRNETVIQFLDSHFTLGRKKVGTGFHSTFMNSLFLC